MRRPPVLRSLLLACLGLFAGCAGSPQDSLSKLELQCEPISVKVGGTSQCTVIALDQHGEPFAITINQWRVGNPDVATVDETGKVSAQARGTTSVTAEVSWSTGYGPATTRLTIVVEPFADRVTVKCDATARLVGKTVKCEASTRDQLGANYPFTNYVWTSSDETVARVDAQGTVSLVGLGTTNITASVTDKGITQVGLVTLTINGPTEHRGPITVSETWRRANNPHVVTAALMVGGPQAPVLTLESGVEVLFEPGAALVIGSDEQNPGTLRASGTADRPIRLSARSDTPQPGHWAGVFFFQASKTQTSRLAYTTIEYAGAALSGMTPTAGVQQFNGALNVFVNPEATSSDSRLSVSNLEVRKSKEYGVVLGARLSFDVTKLRSSENGRAGIVAAADAVGSLPADSQFTDNAINEVLVWGGEVKTTQTWHRWGIPYRLISLVDSQPAYVSVGNSPSPVLTLEAGTTFLMPAGSAFLVGLSNGGGLIATGTANEPIRFVADSPSPTPGFWSGLHFLDASSTSLSYVQVSHAGAKLNGTLGGGAVNLYRELGALMTQSTLTDSSGCGFSVAATVTTDFTQPEYGNVFANLAGANQCRQ